MAKIACFVVLALAGCALAPDRYPPTPAGPKLYRQSDIVVYVATDGSVVATDAACSAVSWYASGRAFAGHFADGLAAEGFRVVTKPVAGAFVLTPMLRLTHCTGAADEGSLAVSVNSGGVVVDYLRSKGAQHDPRAWGRDIGRSLVASTAVAAVIAGRPSDCVEVPPLEQIEPSPVIEANNAGIVGGEAHARDDRTLDGDERFSDLGDRDGEFAL